MNPTMSIVAPAANPFFCSSPSLSTRHPSLQFALQCLPNRTSHKPLLLKCSIRVPRASPPTSSSATEESQPPKSEASEEGDLYEVELDKPYGLRFLKGSDGATYIDVIAPGSNADVSGKFTVGDKVIATSAVFGTEIWPAAEYGRTMYTIRQRIGPLLMKMEKRYGKLPDVADLTEKEIIRAERNSGVVSDRVREIQMQNYLRKKQQKEQRQNDLLEGLKLYRLEDQRDGLEAELKKVNASLAAASARLKKTREEKDQFDDASNQMIMHLKAKEDELAKSVTLCNVEADVFHIWINFLQDTWKLQSSYVEQKDKQINSQKL